MTDSACLTGETAAVYVRNDVELAAGAGNVEGLIDDELQSLKTEVFVNILAVDYDRACSGEEADARNGAFTSAGAVEIRLRASEQRCRALHRRIP